MCIMHETWIEIYRYFDPDNAIRLGDQNARILKIEQSVLSFRGLFFLWSVFHELFASLLLYSVASR